MSDGYGKGDEIILIYGSRRSSFTADKVRWVLPEGGEPNVEIDLVST